MQVIVVVALIFVGFWAVATYNGLIRLRAQLERAWSNIDVLLKQRHDEIPQLIQVIEQNAEYESGVISSLVEARTRYGSANSIPEKIAASQELSLALRGVMAIGESYPVLKANEAFQQLISRVSSLENGISDRRETYNDAVANFNTRIEQIPDVFAAKFLNYERQESFIATADERQKPSLKMNLPKFGKGA